MVAPRCRQFAAGHVQGHSTGHQAGQGWQERDTAAAVTVAAVPCAGSAGQQVREREQVDVTK